MSKILSYFRPENRGVKEKAKLLVDTYGSKLNDILVVHKNEAYRDILMLLSLNLGGTKEIEIFLKEQHELFEAISKALTKEVKGKK